MSYFKYANVLGENDQCPYCDPHGPFWDEGYDCCQLRAGHEGGHRAHGQQGDGNQRGWAIPPAHQELEDAIEAVAQTLDPPNEQLHAELLEIWRDTNDKFGEARACTAVMARIAAHIRA